MLNHIGTQPITTNRLKLRRFTVDDCKYAFEKWTSSSDSKFWEPAHNSIEETEHMINEYVKNYNDPDWYMWAIVYENELIGLVCGNEINEDIKSICIGYCLTKSCWNKGIATEASKALIKYFFIENPDQGAFLAMLNNECIGSIRVCKRWNGNAFIDDLAIDRAHRGHGVGSALMDAAVQWGKEKGLYGVSLETQDWNLLACRFYLKYGFKLGGIDTKVYTHPLYRGETALYFYMNLDK